MQNIKHCSVSEFIWKPQFTIPTLIPTQNSEVITVPFIYSLFVELYAILYTLDEIILIVKYLKLIFMMCLFMSTKT